MATSRYVVNRSAYLPRRGGTDWTAERVETWFLNYDLMGSFTIPGGHSLISVSRALAGALADREVLTLTTLGRLFRKERTKREFFYETIATSHGAVLQALSGLEAFARNEDEISIELEFRINVDTLLERPAFFALDLAASVLTLSSECWSVFQPDNSREVALAYLADQGLLLEAEHSSPDLGEIEVATDLAALSERARAQGGIPIDRETLEFARGCVLVLAKPDPPILTSNQHLSVLNHKRLAGLVSAVSASLGSSWKPQANNHSNLVES